MIFYDILLYLYEGERLHPVSSYGNRCRGSQPNIRQSSGHPTEDGEKEGLQEPEVSRTPQEDLLSQLTIGTTGAHRDGHQPESTQELDLGSLHICSKCVFMCIP